MTIRDIADVLPEMCGADVSHSLIDKVTDAAHEEVQIWQNRPLESLYPILYLDGIVVKVHQDKRVVKKAVYVAFGVTIEGHKLQTQTSGHKRRNPEPVNNNSV